MKLPIQEHVDDSVFAAIDLVIATASASHFAMSVQLLRILNPQGGMRGSLNPMVITLGMKIDTVLGLLKTLVRLNAPKIADEFDTAADALRTSFTKKRDVLAHNAFGMVKGKRDRILAYRVKTVGKLEWTNHALTETEMRKWAAEIHTQATKIDDLLTTAGFPPWKEWRASFG